MIGRRRFISIIAGAGLGLAMGPAAAAGRAYRWKGTALGAAAQIVLPRENAPDLVATALAEVARLERIFSLYRRDSALSRLNAAGQLSDPPPELLELLGICRAVHRMTGGAFDPTIQPLWRLYAEAYSSGRKPSQGEIDNALQSTGWDLLHFSPKEIGFRAAGCALSLNGIAQGYITDRVAQLLRAEGLSNVLVDMGEIVALGRRPDGRPWQVAVDDHIGQRVLPVSHGAIATSSSLGTAFDPAGTVGHILDPRTGKSTSAWHHVTVTGPKAALADGISTGLCIMCESECRSIPLDYTIRRI
ncbi:MAG: FAD:protein FMN transferase [Alphaproteobacteria bacterium]|nr:FAD:protein FMN transferase [Alphaproteobacteria bacterium]